MLVSLANMKTYLGISGTTYDAFLTEQLTLISDVVEAYCRRTFTETDYIQTYYGDDCEATRHLQTFQFPLIAVASVEQDDVELDADEYRIHLPTGTLTRKSGYFLTNEVTVVTYTAGYEIIPTPVQAVVKSLVEERYNKKVSGVALNFGSDVQRISIPGAISIDFDYSLESNERTSAFGSILGTQSNILDAYRSERAVIGSGKLEYVEAD